MVDREGRDKLAQQLRRFAVGRVTNSELEEALPLRTKDRTLQEVAYELEIAYENVWGRPYRLSALSRDERRSLARCVTFLYSDAEYLQGRRPIEHVLDTCAVVAHLTVLPTCLWLFVIRPVCRRTWPDVFGEKEEDRVWPFKTQLQLDQVLRYPRLFAGPTS